MKSKIEIIGVILFMVILTVILIPINIVLYSLEFLIRPFKKDVQCQKVHTWDEEVNKIAMKF